MLQDLLRSKLRAKLLAHLFSHPGERFFARQLEGIITESQGNISRQLSRLEALGLVLAEREGRQKFYKADERSSIYPEIRGIVLKTEGLADVLRKALKRLKGVRVAFVYGSFPEGKPSPQSDVDMIVIGNVSFANVVGALQSAQEKLRREVNPVVYSIAEFRNKVQSNDHFVSAVMGTQKIFLIGDERELAGVAEKRLAD